MKRTNKETKPKPLSFCVDGEIPKETIGAFKELGDALYDLCAELVAEGKIVIKDGKIYDADDFKQK